MKLGVILAACSASVLASKCTLDDTKMAGALRNNGDLTLPFNGQLILHLKCVDKDGNLFKANKGGVWTSCHMGEGRDAADFQMWDIGFTPFGHSGGVVAVTIPLNPSLPPSSKFLGEKLVCNLFPQETKKDQDPEGLSVKIFIQDDYKDSRFVGSS